MRPPVATGALFSRYEVGTTGAWAVVAGIIDEGKSNENKSKEAEKD